MSSVSLVVTLKDEARSINRFVSALRAQTRQPDEYIVVDAGSTDGTVAAVENGLSHHPRVSVSVVPGANRSEGRNRGIEAAASSIIAVTDGGTVAHPDWLEKLVRPLEEEPALAVSSGFFEPAGERWFERALAATITPPLYEINPSSFMPSSRSVAFRKEWWARVGGYPEWLDPCEDLVFDFALRQAGARFRFEPAALVTWTPRSSFSGFFHQYFSYARGDGRARILGYRHAARYSAYVLGVHILRWRRHRFWAFIGLSAGALFHFQKYMLRVKRSDLFDSQFERVAAVAMAPALVITGDIAKMVGYPAGRLSPPSVTSPKPREYFSGSPCSVTNLE